MTWVAGADGFKRGWRVVLCEVETDTWSTRDVPAFAELLGCDKIRVNSLHGQGILDPGKRVLIEGIAEDGTIEAIRIADAKSFALGVQWHAEYDPQHNPINRKLFEAFGEAMVARQKAAA